MGAPVGPTGVTCKGSSTSEVAARGARVGLSYGYFKSDLTFDGTLHVGMSRHAVVLASELPLGSRSTLQLAAGGIAEGLLTTGDRAYDMGPGWLASASFAYRIAELHGPWPFLLATGTLGASAARTTLQGGNGDTSSLSALDLRIGVVAGWTFAEQVSPYLAARVFGGPVTWEYDDAPVTGTDDYHYQPAVGVALSLGPMDLNAEWAFLGERGFSAGVGAVF